MSRLTWRRFGDFLDRLPPESQMRTAVNNALGPARLAALAEKKRADGTKPSAEKFGSWSHNDHLLAALIDRIALLESTVIAVQGGTPAPIVPIPRPGVLPVGTTSVAGAAPTGTSTEQQALLERHRARVNELQRIERIKREAEQRDLTRGN